MAKEIINSTIRNTPNAKPYPRRTIALLADVLKKGVFPKLTAAQPEQKPEKPTEMKFSELPLYESPHIEYSEHEDSKKFCKGHQTKLLNDACAPYITCARECSSEAMINVESSLRSFCADTRNGLHDTKEEITKYMRDPENLNLRYGVTGFGGLAGFLYAFNRGVPSKVLYTGLGVLAAGALCFPNETDENFRNFCYYTASGVLVVFNFLYDTDYSLNKKIICKSSPPK